MTALSLFHVAALLVTVAGSTTVKPRTWKKCFMMSEDYESCLQREVKNAIEYLSEGEEWNYLDPLVIPHIFYPGINSKLAFNTTNVHLTGFKDIDIKNIKNNWERMLIEAVIPELVVCSGYEIDGSFRNIPVKGAGESTFTFSHVTINALLEFDFVVVEGNIYIELEKLRLLLFPQKLDIQLTNLFEGDKAKEDLVHAFMNEDWDVIFSGMRQQLTEKLTESFKDIANTLLFSVPAQDIV